MNKKINDFCVSHNLKVDNNCAYGNINGYETNIVVNIMNNVTPVVVHFSCYTKYDQQQVIIKSLKEKKIKFMQYSFDRFGLIIGLNDLTIGRLMNRMDTILKDITDILNDNDAKAHDYCPVCGELMDPNECKKYDVDGMQITLDNKCSADINAMITQENIEFEAAPNNYLKGFLGTLIGALVGVISFIILYWFNFISALSAFVSVVLGAFLYKKFGGKPNKIMVIMVSLVSIVSLLLTVFILYVMVAELVAVDYGYTSTGIKAFTDMMNVAEFSGEFIYNFVLTLFFTLIGSGYEIFVLSKAIKREKTI